MKIFSIVWGRPDLLELQRAAVQEHYPEADHIIAVNCMGALQGDIEIPCNENPRENKPPNAYFRGLEYLIEQFPTGDFMCLEADMIPIRRVPPVYLERGFSQGIGRDAPGMAKYWPGAIMIPAGKRHLLTGLLMVPRSSELEILQLLHTTNIKAKQTTLEYEALDYIGYDGVDYFVHIFGGDLGVCAAEIYERRKRLWDMFRARYTLTEPYRDRTIRNSS